MSLGVRIRPVDARIDREEGHRTRDEPLGFPAEQEDRKVARPQHTGQGFARHQRWDKRAQRDIGRQIRLDAVFRGEDSHALQRVAQREQVEVRLGSPVTGSAVPRLQRALANEEFFESPVPGFDRRTTYPYEMLGAVVVAAKGMGSASGGLNEDQNPALRIVSGKLLHERRDRRRDTLPATSQDRALDLLEPVGTQPDAQQLRESVLILVFAGTTHHVPAAEVLQVVGEGAQGRHDVIDVGDVLLPLRLLVFPKSQLVEVDAGSHESTTFFPAPMRRAHSSRRPDSAASNCSSVSIPPEK